MRKVAAISICIFLSACGTVNFIDPTVSSKDDGVSMSVFISPDGKTGTLFANGQTIGSAPVGSTMSGDYNGKRVWSRCAEGYSGISLFSLLPSRRLVCSVFIEGKEVGTLIPDGTKD